MIQGVVVAGEKSSGGRVYYGWTILAVTFAMLFFGSTIRQSFGLFFKPILAEFQMSRAALSLPIALSLILYGVSQPIGGLLIRRYGSRAIITIGTILTAIAILGMSQISSFWGIYLFYGIILGAGGIGNSFTGVAPLLTNWFRDRRGFALSIASSGSSTGQLLGVPVLVLLLAALGWRTTFFWVGIALLLGIVPLCFFMIRNEPGEAVREGSGPSPGGAGQTTSYAIPYDLPWVQCLHKTPFILLLTSFFTCGFTVTVIGIHWIPFATDVGFSAAVAASAFAVGGGLNTVGTLIAGPLSDRLGRKIPLSLIYLFRGSGFLLFIFFKNDVTVWATPMMIGLSWIATVPLTSALTGDFFGARNVGVLFGLITLSHQLGAGLSAWLSGYIYDVTGSYDLAFALAAYLCLQAAVIVFFINEKETRRPLAAAAPEPA
jgi:sugar phosphate permease